MLQYTLRLGSALLAGLTATSALVVAAPVVRPGGGVGPAPSVRTARPNANNTARTTLVAGGATLPALGYMGSFAGAKFLAAPSDAKSLFGYFDTVNALKIQYCQTGSGFGKSVLDGDANAVPKLPTSYAQEAVNQPCASGKPVAGTNGFASTQSLSDPDVTGSDAPITQTEYTDFITNKHSNVNAIQPDRGEPVQVPYVVGSVAIFYNNPDVNSSLKRLNLSSLQICGIANGSITDFHTLSSALPSRKIHFIYRSDGSGTTFSFSNWLVKNSTCKDNAGAGSGLSVSQNFHGATGVNVETTLAATAVFGSASGNGSVTSCVASNTNCDAGTIGGSGTGYGSIAYVEAANAKASRSGTAIDYAKVASKDPIANLPEAANAIAATLDVDKVVQFNAGGLATAPALAPAPATAGCVTFVDPGAYNALTTGYPIVAVSNLDFGQKANGATNAANLQKLAKTPATGVTSSTPNMTGGTIVFANGYKIGATSGGGTPAIDSIDAATSVAGTGVTGYATLPATLAPAVNATINTAIGCIGA